MYIYKGGSIVIWSTLNTGETVYEQYFDYTIKEAMHLFREKYPSKLRETKGTKRVNFCPYIF